MSVSTKVEFLQSSVSHSKQKWYKNKHQSTTNTTTDVCCVQKVKQKNYTYIKPKMKLKKLKKIASHCENNILHIYWPSIRNNLGLNNLF